MGRHSISPNTLSQCGIFDVITPGPLRQCFCFIVICYHMISSYIIGLFKSCSPFAIFRSVIFVIINSLKGKPFLSFTHISKKIGKVTPSFANFNSTPPIVFVCWILLIVTTLVHSMPRFMCEYILPSNAPLFDISAPTRFSVSIQNLAAGNNGPIPALTETNPKRTTIHMRKTNNFKPAKSFTFKISKCSMGWNFNHLQIIRNIHGESRKEGALS